MDTTTKIQGFGSIKEEEYHSSILLLLSDYTLWNFKGLKNTNRAVRKKGSGRKVKSEELDELLFHWFVDAKSLKFPVDNQSIITKAIQIKEALLAEAKNILEKAKLEDDEEIIKKTDEISMLDSCLFGKNWLQ